MKIVNRKGFLQLPSGTLYSKYRSSGIVDGLYEKGDSLTNDWYYVDLLGEIEANNDVEFHDAFREAEQGKEFSLDYECGCRDGSYEEDAMFVTYSKKDVYKLIGQLSDISTKYI